MKHVLLTALVLTLGLTLSAQQVRTNYRSGKIVHISTEYETLSFGDDPAGISLEQATFPGGSTLYLLRINLEQKAPLIVPKGVKMAFNLKSGGIIRAEQIGEDSATKTRMENGRYCNRLKYAIEAPDMQRIVGGVKSIEMITGWNPDDYLQVTFSKDELGNLLNRHISAIQAAQEKTIDLSAELAGYSDNQESILATTRPIVAHGQERIYNVILSYLYYKTTNEEDVDLAFQIGTEAQCHVPLDGEVVFTLSDGSTLSLPQTRDEINFVYLYPSMSDVRRLSEGVTAVHIPLAEGALEDQFTPGEGLAEAINAQYQTLLSISPR